MTHKKALKLFFQSFLLLLLLFALARMISHQSSMFAVLEMVVLVILLLLSVAGLSAYRNVGNKILFLIFLIYTVNVLLFKAENPHLVPGLLLVSLVGLLVSMPRRATGCVDCTCEEPLTSTPPPQKVVEAPVVQVEAGKEKTAPAKTKFIPGKYVASKRSNVYHEPKCEWAKKIQKARQVWFASREEALNKGYKKHDCVK